MPPKLDPALVVDTALRLLNETGLDGLTLRRIATELDVKAPALYWHFSSKQALLDAMATQLFRFAAAEPAPGPHAPWQEWVGHSCRTLRRTLLRYRDGAKVFSGTRFQGTDHAEVLERYLAVLLAAGFALDDAVLAFATGYAFTIGFVIEEQAVHPLPGEQDPYFDPDTRAARIGPEHPAAAAAGPALFTGFEERFERGLAILLAGIAVTTPGLSGPC
ncbi:TetR/AcrR family transcriptional regulator C-terminal domain-containing protein [Kitasatospora sp. NBC_01287]|uniref:TetR/AcrR family transcriptional regulator C-terminal domain-containing protein n=1 Tax=Kitasatospora sp. NBC_01287 TaxID=2903573 RepID=UPI00224DC5D1|nr:TetR/AcrR family transcriptional regulator C-terminal domain-containing protein [Kitasatospora sp. NBC_01287]MCX4749473.1 TetR/AcrR family transcriptional regulator C-terminal domain-containing protein [Kitasatospora sp. NBC_01287]